MPRSTCIPAHVLISSNPTLNGDPGITKQSMQSNNSRDKWSLLPPCYADTFQMNAPPAADLFLNKPPSKQQCCKSGSCKHSHFHSHRTAYQKTKKKTYSKRFSHIKDQQQRGVSVICNIYGPPNICLWIVCAYEWIWSHFSFVLCDSPTVARLILGACEMRLSGEHRMEKYSHAEAFN